MVKHRYSARAILAVASASVLFAFCVITGFLFMALLPPLIPVFISVLMGNACLLGRALEYATRVSGPMPTGMLPTKAWQQSRPEPARHAHDLKTTAQAPRGARRCSTPACR